jgi:hypothetical protein
MIPVHGIVGKRQIDRARPPGLATRMLVETRLFDRIEDFAEFGWEKAVLDLASSSQSVRDDGDAIGDGSGRIQEDDLPTAEANQSPPGLILWRSRGRNADLHPGGAGQVRQTLENALLIHFGGKSQVIRRTDRFNA